MKHKIFIGQATLKMGRDRQHRMLEAKLDGLSRTTSIPKSKPKTNCPHYEYCNVRTFGKINCLFNYKDCQTYKFYERYGEDYNEMFVG